jgi:hypothetical protein
MLFKFISDYLPYFEKKIYFSISYRKSLNSFIRIDQSEIDTSICGILVIDGITHPVVSVAD